MSEWLSILEYHPDHNEIVCVYDEYSDFMSLARCIHNDDELEFDLMYVEEIEGDSSPTHWMRKPTREDLND